MPRLAFLPALALVLLLASCGSQKVPPQRIVLISLDTVRADRLGPYGYERARTPSLDRFASRGVVYERAWTVSPWTVPSHASMLTGLLPVQHGAVSGVEANDAIGTLGTNDIRRLQDHFVTLAEALGANGYATAATVAAPTLGRAFGMAQGFDRYHADFTRAERGTGRRGGDVTDDAIALLESFGDAPGFLFINYYDAHSPYYPPLTFDSELPPPNQVADAYYEVQQRLTRRRRWPVEKGDRDLQLIRRAYDEEIRYLDGELERLFEALEREPNTLVVVTADHGESFGEHDWQGHGVHLFEDNLRVPLIVRWPYDRAAGTRVSTPVQNHRVYSTILQAAGIATDGYAGPLSGPPEPIVGHITPSGLLATVYKRRFYREQFALIDYPFKLLRSESGKEELFDLESDPGEREDLADARPELRTRLGEMLTGVLEERPARYEDGGAVDLDEDTAEALRELGYIQ